jgi:hypothetical protein
LGLRTVAKSEVAEQFAGWDLLGGFAWARILSRRPEFADRCDWSNLKTAVDFNAEARRRKVTQRKSEVL